MDTDINADLPVIVELLSCTKSLCTFLLHIFILIIECSYYFSFFTAASCSVLSISHALKAAFFVSGSLRNV